jgi:hypothetical protein
MATPKSDELPEEEDPVSSPPIEEAVEILLAPYLPCSDYKDCDKKFSTNEIISALEIHYGVPQGNLDFHTPDAGLRVIAKLKMLGYQYINAGELNLMWMFKRKSG